MRVKRFCVFAECILQIKTKAGEAVKVGVVRIRLSQPAVLQIAAVGGIYMVQYQGA